MIYADNAATTQLAPEALEAMMPFLTTEYGNASQPYSFARSAKQALKNSREIIAKCINALPEEIVFTSGGTEGDNWCIKEIMLNSERGSELITSEIEHHAILNSSTYLEKKGYSLTLLPVDSTGRINPANLRNAISDNTKLVSIMFSNNEVGSIQPIKDLAQISHKNNALFHTDAVQAVGHVKVDVRDLGVDFLTTSAHKFNGPKGVGFIYIKKGINLTSHTNGGSQEFGLRAGTENIPSIVGMATAFKINCDKLEANSKYLTCLEEELIKHLDAFNLDYRRNGSDIHIPGNVSLSFRGYEGEMILHRLDLMGICVSTGSACDSKNTQISHVLRAMQVPKEYAVGTIRISLGMNNTVEDVRRIAVALRKIIK